MFVQFANEGGSHGSQQRAVVQLESHLGADRQFLICRLQDKVITAGTAYPDSSGRFEALRIDVLSADRHDTLQDSSAIFGGLPHAEGSLRNMTPRFRRLDLGLNHFRDKCYSVGVKSGNRFALERFAPEKDGFT